MARPVTRERHRKSIRLKDYDYSRPGAYFVTTCTHGRECILGDIEHGTTVLSRFGSIVSKCWYDLPRHYKGINIDAFVIMPNHIHGIVILTEDITAIPRKPQTVGAGLGLSRSTDATVPMQPRASIRSTGPRPAPTQRPSMRIAVPEIVRAFKSFSAHRINGIRHTRGMGVWQRGYYEHVIRNLDELNRARSYIINNPLHWSGDPENPECVTNDHEHNQHEIVRG